MAATSSHASADQQRILLTQAEAGMVLAQPVVSAKRAVLCVSGAKLSDDLIHRLMLLGIKRVVVRGNPAPAMRRPAKDERLAMLEQRFARLDNHPLMNQVRDTVRRHLSRDEL